MNPTGKLEASIGVANRDAFVFIAAIVVEMNRLELIPCILEGFRRPKVEAEIVPNAASPIKLLLLLVVIDELLSVNPGTAPLQEV